MTLLFDQYFPGTVGLIFLILGFIYHMYRRLNPQKTEEAEFIEQQRKSELARVISTRKDRELQECIDENKFWELIEKTRERAKPGYKSRLGVLRMLLSNQLSPDDIIRFDNYHNQLIREYLNYDICATSTIIFSNSDIYYSVLIMDIFMFEGEIFFKNACINPNLIIGKPVDEIEKQTIEDMLGDLYYRKTNELIPLYKHLDENWKIDGEPWTEKDLPSRYAELWEAFA